MSVNTRIKLQYDIVLVFCPAITYGNTKSNYNNKIYTTEWPDVLKAQTNLLQSNNI